MSIKTIYGISIISSFLLTGSVEAATLAVSNLSINLNNFKPLPQETDNYLIGDNSAIANQGVVKANFDGNLDFIVNKSISYIQGDFQTKTLGKGKKYFGLGQIVSQAVGEFSLEANESMSFKFNLDLNLENRLGKSDLSSIGNFTGFRLFLVDSKKNRVIDNFSLSANLETNSLEEDNQDYIFSYASKNIKITNYTENPIFGGNKESATAQVTGYWEKRFLQPKQITVITQTINKSCVQSKEVTNACYLKVPEPSNNIIGVLIWVLAARLISRFR